MLMSIGYFGKYNGMTDLLIESAKQLQWFLVKAEWQMFNFKHGFLKVVDQWRIKCREHDFFVVVISSL